MPRVTVLMCSYQSERFIDEAIASVVSQDFQDWELVVVDDGSTDSTPLILRRWAEREPRIVLLMNSVNRGNPHASNRGLAAARGEYVARLDADDLFLPGRLRSQVELLDRHPEVVLASCAYEIIDAEGRLKGRVERAAPSVVTQYLLHFSNYIGGNSQVMFRSDAARAAGGYVDGSDLSQDYDLWTRLIRSGRFVVTGTRGMRYRLHDRQASAVRRPEQRDTGVHITRRMLSELLEREVSQEETEAVASVWLQECRRDSAACANRVLSEAYGRFKRANSNRAERRMVRVETARRWMLAGAMFAWRRDILESARHVALALSWHPLGALAGAMAVLLRLSLAVRRLPAKNERN
jgi:hypothetical protein